MHHLHRLRKDIHEDGYDPVLLSLVSGIERKLGGFHIPVAEIIPEEVVCGLRSLIELVAFDGIPDFQDILVQAVVYPFVNGIELGRIHRYKVAAVEVHQKISGCVPYLVGEP